MTDDYPQDAIDRVLGKPGAGPPVRPNDVDRIYLAAGCPCGITHTHVGEALARGLEAQRVAATTTEMLSETVAELRHKAHVCERDARIDRDHGPSIERSMRLLAKATAYGHAAEMLEATIRRAGLRGDEP